MSSAIEENLELREIRQIFAWGRAHIAKHVDGAFPRNRDENRTANAADAGNIRWRTRCLEAIVNTSFLRNSRKRARWRAMMALANLPAVPADLLDGNQAYGPGAPGDAAPENLILAFLVFAIESTDQQKARSDLAKGAAKQGVMRAEDFLEEYFDPLVHVAQLENTQYADALLKAANDGIHKKMAAKGIFGLQTRLREYLGTDRWGKAPVAVRAKFVEEDLTLLTLATDEPFSLDDYLIAADKVASVSEEAAMHQKVAAVRNEANTAMEDLKKVYDGKFAKLESDMASTKADVQKVDTKVEDVNTSVKAMLEMMAKQGERLEAQAAAQTEILTELKGIQSSKSNSNRPKCNYCGKPGHYEKNCFAKSEDTRIPQALSNSPLQETPMVNEKVSAIRGDEPQCLSTPATNHHVLQDNYLENRVDGPSTCVTVDKGVIKIEMTQNCLDPNRVATPPLAQPKDQINLLCASSRQPQTVTKNGKPTPEIEQHTNHTVCSITYDEYIVAVADSSNIQERESNTCTSGSLLDSHCRSVQYELFQVANQLEELQTRLIGGTNAEEVWLDMLIIGEKVADIFDCTVTDIMQAGDCKNKWRIPRLWTKTHSSIAPCYVTNYSDPFDGSQEHCELADTNRRERKAEKRSQVTDIVWGAWKTIEQGLQQYEITYSHRKNMKDPGLPTDPLVIRGGLAEEIREVQGAIVGKDSSIRSDGSIKQGIIHMNDIIDEVGDCFICAFMLKKTDSSLQQPALDSTPTPTPALSSTALTPVIPDNHSTAAAAAVTTQVESTVLQSTKRVRTSRDRRVARSRKATQDTNTITNAQQAADRILSGEVAAVKQKRGDKTAPRHKTRKPKLVQNISPQRKTDRDEAATFVKKLTKSNHTVRKQLTLARLQNRIRARDRIKVLHTKGVAEQILNIKRWQRSMKQDKEESRRTVAATFHSILIIVEIKYHKEWVKVIAIADTGSGPSILRLVDIDTAISMNPAWRRKLEKPDVTLLTADGSILKNLCGATDVQIRVPGGATEHTIRAQLVDTQDFTPITGVDFWKRAKARFEFDQDRIVIPSSGDSPETVFPFVTSAPHRISAVTTGTRSEDFWRRATARFRCDEEPEQPEVTPRLQPPVTAVARAAVDIVLTPGEKLEEHFPVELCELSGEVHCADVFEVDGINRHEVCLTPESLDADDGLFEISDEHVMQTEKVAHIHTPTDTTIKMSPVMPSVSSAQYDQATGTTWMAIPLCNPDPNNDMVIRRGDKIATVCQTEWSCIQDTPAMARCKEKLAEVASLATTIASVSSSAPNTVEVDKSDWSQQRLTLDRMTGREIISYVKEGHVIVEDNGVVTTFKQWMDDVGDNLTFGKTATEEFKDDMCHLLYALRRLFAENPKGPRPIKGVEARLDLKDPSVLPVRCKHRRYSESEKATIKSECQQMLDNGIIEYSDSAWCAPIVLVKKKDGGVRMCVNFTASCNPYLKHDSMPLPHVQDIFDNLEDAAQLSLFDACSGYWQIFLREEDRHLTAFSNGDTLMQFVRCPFGLATSGSVFCRTMERILRRDERGLLLHNTVDLFVDDGCIPTDASQDHLEETARVLKQLWRNDVSLKMSKCIWGTNEAHMIGHHIKCGEGVAADPIKIADIAAMKRPHNIGVLQSFLGSCVYMARYVKDFAELVGPLYSLLASKSSPGTSISDTDWTAQCQRAFKTVKAALCSSPVLAFPDFTAPFIILCDCSQQQLGGCLIQLDKSGRERVIAYTSKRLTKAQMNWGVTSKESAAVTHCTRKWRSYIQNHPTVVITDHAALTSINSRTDFDTERLARVAAELMEHEIHICHRPGKYLDLGDLMSRAEFETDPDERNMMLTDMAVWRKQLEDTNVLPKVEERKRKHKADDIIGETTPDVEEKPPWAQSQAKRALEGDETAYTPHEIAKYLQLMVRGAGIDVADDSCENLKQKVELMTAQMRAGTYDWTQARTRFDREDEDPRIVDAYDQICSAVGWKPPVVHRMPDGDAIKKAQEFDPFVIKTMKEITIAGHSGPFEVHHGILVREQPNPFTSEVTYQKYLPLDLRSQALSACHMDLKSSHYADLRTYAVIRDHFWWPGIYTDVTKFVQRCELCTRFGNHPSKTRKTHHLSSQIPGEHWVVDVCHFKEASGGYSYLLTMIDVCTRWAIVQPMKDCNSQEATRIVLENWGKVGVHISPKRITHDGGSEFKGMFEDMCAALQQQRHVSLHDRPAGHGVVERFNRSLCQIIGKLIAEHPAEWLWVAQIGADTHNSCIHAPMKRGSYGITPSEAMHGLKPALWGCPDASELESILKCTEAGSRQHIEAITAARKQALTIMQEARAEYHKTLDADMAKIKTTRHFKIGDLVRVASHVKSRKQRKVTYTHSVKQVIVRILGYGNYKVQPFGDAHGDIKSMHAEDIIHEKGASTEEISAAHVQADEANTMLTEYEVEEITKERGVKAHGTKEYLVKYKGYPEPEWQPADVIDADCQPLIDFNKAKKNPKTKKKKAAAVAIRTAGKCTSIKVDISQIEDTSIIDYICSLTGIQPEDILFNFNGVPCETYSQAARTGKGRSFAGSVHGCNYRLNDMFRSPCCPPSANCKYGNTARAHDELVQKIVAGIEHDKARGYKYDFGIENPRGELVRREFMQPSAWTTPMVIKHSDCCAFKYALECKKPMTLATNMLDYEPTGVTGNGLCNQGQCGLCLPSGGHRGQLGRDPKRGPRGKGAKKAKNSLPPMWLKEILQHAVDRAAADGRHPTVVVDLCAGWQSLQPVCAELGLDYIAVDLFGDRNLPSKNQEIVTVKTAQNNA